MQKVRSDPGRGARQGVNRPPKQRSEDTRRREARDLTSGGRRGRVAAIGLPEDCDEANAAPSLDFCPLR